MRRLATVTRWTSRHRYVRTLHRVLSPDAGHIGHTACGRTFTDTGLHSGARTAVIVHADNGRPVTCRTCARLE